jgi:hypothetical protein
MFTVFNNFLEKETQVNYYNNFINTSGWAYTGFSVDSNLRFWFLSLDDHPFFTNFMLEQIKRITGHEFSLTRVYANGQTHGQCGLPHYDSAFPNSYTFLYYLNPEWLPEWGGSTVFLNENQESISSPFVPNRGILFKGNTIHMGMEPSCHFDGLRITVAFKLELINSK